MAANDQDQQTTSLEEARRDLAATLDGAAHEYAGNPDELVKPGDAGFSIELRFNGETIALAGNAVNELATADFQAFVDREKPKIEAGDYDAEIEAALAQDGPGKALVRVRAIDAD